MTISLRRKGLQDDDWDKAHQATVDLQPSEAYRARLAKNVTLDFIIAHGRGQGCIGIDISPDSFFALAQAMMEIHPAMASEAFDAAKAIGKRQIPYDAEGSISDWAPLPHEKAQR